MNVLAFELDGVVIRFEVDQGSTGYRSPGGSGVVSKSGKLGEEGAHPEKPDSALLNRATATLTDAAFGARKIVELFANTLSSASMDSVSVALGVKLQGEAGFVFVNSKAEASITVTATIKMNRQESSQ